MTPIEWLVLIITIISALAVPVAAWYRLRAYRDYVQAREKLDLLRRELAEVQRDLAVQQARHAANTAELAALRNLRRES